MEKAKSIFPLNALPKLIQLIILEAKKYLNLPVNYVAAAMLFSASVAIGNTCKLQIKATWQERPLLFMAFVGRSGSRKSPSINFALKPLLESDNLTLLKYKQAHGAWAKTPIKKRGEKPNAQQLRVQDATMESITQILGHSRHGIYFHADELRGWIGSFNRYNNGSGDQEQWLSIWSGIPITVNRKTQDAVVHVQEPFVGVIGGIQYGVMSRLFAGERMDNGMFNRLLFVHNSEEDLPVVWNDLDDRPCTMTQKWHDIINSILSSGGYFENKDIMKEYHLSESAKILIINWQSTMEQNIKSEAQESEEEIFRKIQTYCFRIILIIHRLREAVNDIPVSDEIDARTAASAIAIADFFFEQALIAYEEIRCADFKQLFILLDSLNETFTSEQAELVGEHMGLSRPTVYRLLKRGLDTPFLVKQKHGIYKKK